MILNFMKYTLITILMAVLASNSYSQVDPSTIISDPDYLNTSLKVEKERGEHKLNLEKLISMLENPEHKLIIDLRPNKGTKYKKLRGAINVPLEELTEKRLKELAPDLRTPIIIYCDNSFYPTRTIGLMTYAYPSLRKFGYENVYEIAPLWQAATTSDTPEELAPFLEEEKLP